MKRLSGDIKINAHRAHQRCSGLDTQSVLVTKTALPHGIYVFGASGKHTNVCKMLAHWLILPNQGCGEGREMK